MQIAWRLYASAPPEQASFSFVWVLYPIFTARRGKTGRWKVFIFLGSHVNMQNADFKELDAMEVKKPETDIIIKRLKMLHGDRNNGM